MATARVLITGSAGRIGQAVVRELGPERVRGFDLIPTPGLTDCRMGTLTNPEALAEAMRGVHTLVHLAATPDDADFLTELLPNNIMGLYHTLEAARVAGVKRLVLASSGQVVWWQRMAGEGPIGVEVLPSPRYWYAATKMFLEAIGRGFAEKHDMSVIVVRLGWCPRTLEQVREIESTAWAQDVYLSPGDAGRFFRAAVDAPGELRFAVVYATSKPVHQLPYDLEPAKRLLGWEPQERWPQGIEVVTGKRN